MSATCLSVSEENTKFTEHILENIIQVSDLIVQEYAQRDKDPVSITIGDTSDSQSMTRHFYHGDKRIMSTYIGKQGILIFKTKW